MALVRCVSLVCLLASPWLAACGSRTAVPQPFPTAHRPPPRPGARPPVEVAPGESPSGESPTVASPTADPITATALTFLGAPYRDGGASPSGFDCSGFVAYVFGQHGVTLPRTVEAQAVVGAEVRSPAPGDLVFFRTSGRGPTHVGIALGADRFIHAPSSRGVVRIERLGAPYWAARFLETRRVLEP